MIHLSHRLVQDLGMDGDDTVDFFNNVHERFHTDLTHLHEHWSEHFGREGFSCLNGLVIIAVLSPADCCGAMPPQPSLSYRLICKPMV